MIYKTKMVKVYLSSFLLCIFSLVINLVVLDILTPRANAQNSASQPDKEVAANTVETALEPEILSEINRVRTNPQDYAVWLEEQRRYYDGIWLKLPGEKPIRTNRGLKALEEAIAVLKTQQPLPPLDISEQTAATATSKLENFATADNIQNISYGRVTAKGIVMSIVVDDLFPDRRRRNNLLSPEAANTGVVCKPDPRYAKVCAIAYSDSTTRVDVAETQPSNNTTSETKITASQSQTTENTTTPEIQVPATTPETETTVSQSQTTENTTTPEVQVPATNTEPDSNDNNTSTEVVPQPPQPQTLPGVPEINLSTSESPSADDQNSEVAKADVENEDEAQTENSVETANSDSEEITNENTETANSDSEEITSENSEAELEQPETATDENTETANSDSEEVTNEDTEVESEIADNQDEENVEVFEAETDNSEVNVATNSDSSSLLENATRGILETGDRTIAEDGSLYDSYPLEGKAGDSFTIDLESDEFDPFVALIDDKGNIIKQNDDIEKDNSNSRIEVTIPQDGVYNVIVNAYDQGGKGNYVLTVKQ